MRTGSPGKLVSGRTSAAGVVLKDETVAVRTFLEAGSFQEGVCSTRLGLVDVLVVKGTPDQSCVGQVARQGRSRPDWKDRGTVAFETGPVEDRS